MNRPAHIAQTSTEAKKAHKTNSAGLNERIHGQLRRSVELDERAIFHREREERAKTAKKRREEKEKKEREVRQRNGVGLATQLIGYSHTQAKLKNGMEAFLGYQKRLDRKKDEEDRAKEVEMARKIEAAVDEVAREPWDDDGNAFELPELGTADQWLDDDLDDDTLLEIHDLVTSDPAEEVTEPPVVQKPPTTAPAPILQSLRQVSSKQDIEFVRLHGPISKPIESILDKLPDPLIELLSQDVTKDVTVWNPAPALLHKLNPAGLPPHRLRVKVGCTVILLRDLNSSTQLAMGQHLQIVRMEKDRLECLVLGGQLEGTKTFLTRATFSAFHRNDTRFPFQRLQYPIQVAENPTPTKLPEKNPQSTSKVFSISGQPTRSTSTFKKPIQPLTKPLPKLNLNSSFKIPGLPASKPKPVEQADTTQLDGWDDFFDSGTQIARELTQELPPAVRAPSLPLPIPSGPASNCLPPPSTQDLDFSLDDLDNSPKMEKESKMANSAEMAKKPMQITVDSPWTVTKLASSPYKFTPTGKDRATPIANPVPSRSKPPQYNTALPPSQPPKALPTKRKAPTNFPAQPPPLKRGTAQATTPRVSDLSNPATSFSLFDCCFSTQEAVAFFDDDDDDDDDLAFGSPPEITV